MRFSHSVLNDSWDIGFIDFNRPTNDPEFAQVTPLVPADPWQVTVTEEVAACGYPYGTAMLQRSSGRIYRFGPVIQQGYVAAMAPYDSATPTELLLDLRTAGGMSGSPVFRPSDARLLGIVYAGWEATTAVAVPVNGKNLAQWLALHDNPTI
jgi:hypothetical protein